MTAGLRFRFYVSADVTARDRSVRNRRLHLSLSLPPFLSLFPFPFRFLFVRETRGSVRMPSSDAGNDIAAREISAPRHRSHSAARARARASNRESKEDN